MTRSHEINNITRECIVQAFLTLLRSQNYKEITIGKIMLKAGYDRSTFYRYFKSKEEIARQYYLDILYSGAKRYELPSERREVTAAGVLPGFQLAMEKREEFLLLNQAGMTTQLFYALNQFYQELCPPENIEEEYSLHFRIGGLYNVADHWISNGMTVSPEEMSELYIYAVHSLTSFGCKNRGTDC